MDNQRQRARSDDVRQAQEALDYLVSIGLAWKGADGRYRLADKDGVEGNA